MAASGTGGSFNFLVRNLAFLLLIFEFTSASGKLKLDVGVNKLVLFCHCCVVLTVVFCRSCSTWVFPTIS